MGRRTRSSYVQAQSFWQKHSFDFSSLPTGSLGNTDGDIAIGGVDWELVNGANLTDLAITADGLTFDHSATSTEADGQGQNAPYVFVNLETLLGRTVDENDTITVSAVISSNNAAADREAGGVCIFDNTTSGGNTWGFAALQGASGSAPAFGTDLFLWRFTGDNNGFYTATSGSNALSLVYGNHGVTVEYGSSSGSVIFPRSEEMNELGYLSHNLNPATTFGPTMTPSALKIGLIGQTQNTNGTYQWSVSKFDVFVTRLKEPGL
jgi:hypothetical protein